MGFPGRAEDWAGLVARNAGNSFRRAPGGFRLNRRFFRHVRDKAQTLRWRLLTSGPPPRPKTLALRSARCKATADPRLGRRQPSREKRVRHAGARPRPRVRAHSAAGACEWLGECFW